MATLSASPDGLQSAPYWEEDVCWLISAGGIKRSSFLAYGPENAPELPLLYHQKISHYKGLRFSDKAQTLQDATLPSPDQVCVLLNWTL